MIGAAETTLQDGLPSVEYHREMTVPDDPVLALRILLADYMRFRSPRLEVAAEMSGIGVRTLQRRLEERGLTFTQFVDEIRLEKAAAMLKDSRIAITEIAYDVGYSELAHFTRAFRRMVGTSPSEFRRRNVEGMQECT